MAGADPGDLQLLAEELLAACASALDTIPGFAPGLEGAPERSFVSPGEPAADCCPQLTVHVTSLGEAATDPLGLPQGKRLLYGRINHVALMATIFRCVPTGEERLTGWVPPAVAELEASAEQINADGWAIWNHVQNLVRAGLLFSSCREAFMEGMRALLPSGGCAGWILLMRVQLDGYEETLP